MNGWRTIELCLAVGLLLVTGVVLAQTPMRWNGSQGWGHGGQFLRLYDTNSVVSVTGIVAKIEQGSPLSGMGHGVHLQLKTGTETLSVHLGPAWYLENQDIQIEPQDQLEITGSRVTLNNQPVLIAAEVQKGDQVLRLRDQGGLPAWAGWRSRPASHGMRRPNP